MAVEKELSADELWEQSKKDRQADAPISADVSPAVEIPDAASRESAPAADSGPNPLDGLPEPTRKLIESLQSAVTQQDNRFKEVGQQLARANGLIGQMKQQLDGSQARLQEITPAIDDAVAQRKARKDAEAAEKAEKLKTLRSEVPEDFAEYVDLMLADAKPAPAAEAKPAIQEVQKPAAEEETPEQITRREVTEEALNMLHPGWVEDVKGKEFKEWTKAQTNEVQALLGSDSIKDAATMIGLFRKHKNDAASIADEEKQRQDRLRRGEIVQGRSTGTTGVDPATGNSLWEQAKRDRAKRRAA